MKRVWWLGLLALIVWAGVYFGVGQKKEQTSLWPNFEKKDIFQINFPDFSLKKEQGQWQVRQKNTIFPANKSEVESFLRFLGQNRPKRIIGPIKKAQWATYGLKEKNKISFQGKNFAFYLIYGSENPSFDGIYALTSLWPDKLILLPFSYKNQVQAKVKKFYDLKLFSFSDEELLRLKKIKNGKIEWELKKQGESQFVFVKPLASKKVNVSEATSLFFNLSTLEGTDFVAKPGPKKLLFTLEYTLKDLRQGKVLIFKTKEHSQYLAKVPEKSWYYVLDQIRVNGLDKNVFLLTDRHFLSFNEQDVTRVEFSDFKSDVVLCRHKQTWHFVGTQKEFSGMDFILWELKDLEYVSPPSDNPSKDKKVLNVILQDNQNKVIADLGFWTDKKEKGKFWVRVKGAKKWYLVDTDVVQEIKNKLQGMD
ncbi:MAG: DUF4340 domain-containing protein [Desulfonauticus sp.]|nr:DUF4340 domain-containing protein [Desulfonauticus sp.]